MSKSDIRELELEANSMSSRGSNRSDDGTTSARTSASSFGSITYPSSSNFMSGYINEAPTLVESDSILAIEARYK